MMKKLIFAGYLLCFSFVSFSQTIYQTIKGRVYDNESHQGLPGATVVITGSNPLIGTVTDLDGYFRLDSVPVGRTGIEVSYLGYGDVNISAVLVSSGKEMEINIPLKEKFTALDEVVVKPGGKRDRAMNRMATLSARTFSVEDAQRYAGGMDDPSRLASSFAGVVPNTIDNNEIVIRGNAARGILWRLEGVEIPAPNHLAGLFSGGGVNTMFSSNMLANSDFLTGAFPAEYGNALSGVFDIKLRSGNSDKREYVFQAGTSGIDLSAEGPFVSGEKASYLVNGRYSTYGLIQNLVPQVTGLPVYSDLNLKLNFPFRKSGALSLWSINGTGRIRYGNEKDTSKWETSYDSYDYDIHYNLTASGINYRKILNNDSYLFASAYFTGTRYLNRNSFFRPDLTEIQVANQDEINMRTGFSSYINHKFGSRHTNRTGFTIDRLNYNYHITANSDVAHSDTADFHVNSNGHAYLLQFYTQSGYYLSSDIKINAGIHFTYFGLNKELSFEPRFGVNWQLDNRQTLSFACGKYSRPEPLRIYLMYVPVNGRVQEVNRNLNITKALHFVLGYDLKTGAASHLKIEPYLQRLYDVPVIPDSSFSMINYNNEMFFTSRLGNTGTGRNVGIDLTFERFMSAGYYYLFTVSLFDSKYKGGDKILRNSRYNQHFVINLLGGKEWQTNKSNTFSLNGKFTILGGKRYSPVDIAQSQQSRFVVYDNSRIYEKQTPANLYLDVSLNYVINKPTFSHTFILQVKNLLLQKEFLGHAFNYRNNTVEPYELTLMFPYLSYRISF
ncbi:MAG TPA: carboxypeptidase-like regulatory domain-containing protein [Bacteroidales bacterium]|nr:carboxypeptidase-like regulatory domain-containing protein [Bacteroidales bacterium]